MAERKIMDALRLQGTIEVLADPVGLPQGVSIISKPDRWRVTVSMHYGTGTNNNSFNTLFPRSFEYCKTYWPDDSVQDVDQPPLFYCDYDFAHWLVAPTPPATFPLQVLSYMQPQLLDDSNQTNFFTQYCSPLLLYGALLESAPFLKNDERLSVWQGLWVQEAQVLSGQDLQKVLDRAAQRDRP